MTRSASDRVGLWLDGQRNREWVGSGSRSLEKLVGALALEVTVGLIVSWVHATVVTGTLIVGFLVWRMVVAGPANGPETSKTRRLANELAGLVPPVERQLPQVVLARVGRDDLSAPEPVELRVTLDEAMADDVGGYPLVASDRTLCRWWFRGAEALCQWYAANGRRDDWRALAKEVETAAADAGERGIVRWAKIQLGVVARLDGDPESAHGLLLDALPAKRHWADPQVLTNLGLVLVDLEDHAAAVRQLKRARRHRTRRDLLGRALTEMALGEAYLGLEPTSEAEECFRRAEGHFRRRGEHHLASAAHRRAVDAAQPAQPA